MVDYLLKYGNQYPSYYLPNWDEIHRTIQQGLSKFFLGQEAVGTATGRVAQELVPLLKGRSDR